MRTLTSLDWLATVLVLIGGLNWGLVGFFRFDLVDAIFISPLSRIIYALVGLAALYLVIVSNRFGRKQPTVS